jgi:hypothetical protein
MFKRELTFDDLEGNPITKEFYFHLSFSDLTEWATTEEGVDKHLEKVVSSGNQLEILNAFKELIAKSVGEKNVDGITFDKTPEITRRFMQSDAYSALIIELISDANAAAEFVNGIMPSKFQEKLKAITSDRLEQSEVKDKVMTIDDFTMTQLTNMPYDQFRALMDAANPGSLSKEHLILAFQRKP